MNIDKEVSLRRVIEIIQACRSTVSSDFTPGQAIATAKADITRHLYGAFGIS